MLLNISLHVVDDSLRSRVVSPLPTTTLLGSTCFVTHIRACSYLASDLSVLIYSTLQWNFMNPWTWIDLFQPSLKAITIWFSPSPTEFQGAYWLWKYHPPPTCDCTCDTWSSHLLARWFETVSFAVFVLHCCPIHAPELWVLSVLLPDIFFPFYLGSSLLKTCVSVTLTLAPRSVWLRGISFSFLITVPFSPRTIGSRTVVLPTAPPCTVLLSELRTQCVSGHWVVPPSPQWQPHYDCDHRKAWLLSPRDLERSLPLSLLMEGGCLQTFIIFLFFN